MEKNIINMDLLESTFSKIENINHTLVEENKEKVQKIYELVNDRFSIEQCERMLNIVHARYKILTDRNKETLTSIIKTLFNNQIAEAEASQILNIVVFNLRSLNEDTDFLAEMSKANMGLHDGLSQTDEVENAIGKFGYDKSNPIPINGINMIDNYFRKLTLITGESITYKRVGSVNAENLQWPVDKYNIFSSDNSHVATLYFYAYHGSMTKKAPDGFKLMG